MIDVYGLDAAGSHWRQAAATLATEVLAAYAVEVDTLARFPHEGMSALAQKGFYGLCVDTQSGGHGQGPRLLPQWSRNWHVNVLRPPWFMSCT